MPTPLLVALAFAAIAGGYRLFTVGDVTGAILNFVVFFLIGAIVAYGVTALMNRMKGTPQ